MTMCDGGIFSLSPITDDVSVYVSLRLFVSLRPYNGSSGFDVIIFHSRSSRAFRLLLFKFSWSPMVFMSSRIVLIFVDALFGHCMRLNLENSLHGASILILSINLQNTFGWADFAYYFTIATRIFYCIWIHTRKDKTTVLTVLHKIYGASQTFSNM